MRSGSSAGFGAPPRVRCFMPRLVSGGGVCAGMGRISPQVWMLCPGHEGAVEAELRKLTAVNFSMAPELQMARYAPCAEVRATKARKYRGQHIGVRKGEALYGQGIVAKVPMPYAF